jgi:hypothetical protein
MKNKLFRTCLLMLTGAIPVATAITCDVNDGVFLLDRFDDYDDDQGVFFDVFYDSDCCGCGFGGFYCDVFY